MGFSGLTAYSTKNIDAKVETVLRTNASQNEWIFVRMNHDDVT